MKSYEVIKILPAEFQRKFGMSLTSNSKTDETDGVFKLVAVRKTNPAGFESQRIIVLVLDENGFPMPNVPVAFSYSTATQYIITEDFNWIPPVPHRAFVVPTQGSGQIDQIQGSEIKDGESGGVTVYILNPENYVSDVVSGCGMLSDHTGLHLTFQLKTGAKTIEERITALEEAVGLK